MSTSSISTTKRLPAADNFANIVALIRHCYPRDFRSLWFVLFLIFICSPASGGCLDPIRIGHQCQIAIDLLHPTQGAIGNEEVLRKLRQLQLMSPAELGAYRQRKRVPVVLGPDRELYIIDYHHALLALDYHGEHTALIEVREDFSRFSDHEHFWSLMQERRWVYAFDEHGRPMNPQLIPSRLRQLPDDIYRSLSGILRDSGGYAKKNVPYYEFEWAQRLRKLKVLGLSKPSKEDYQQALDDSLALIRWGYWSDPESCADRLKFYLHNLD